MIRDAVVDDAPAIARVHVDTWRSTYRGLYPADYLEKLSYAESEKRRREGLTNRPDTFTLVADEGGIVGFAVAGPERTGDQEFRGELYAIYILESRQRRGIGRALVDAVVARLLAKGRTSMLIWVLKENPWRRFYEKLGGRLARERKFEIGGALRDELGYGWKDLGTYVAAS